MERETPGDPARQRAGRAH